MPELRDAHRNKIVPASWVFLERDKKILLMKRQNTGWMDGWWSLPSGHVEKGESFALAAVRELEEEVGVVAATSELEFSVAITHPPDEDEASDRIDTFFTCTQFLGEPYNAEPHKCSEVAWFAIDALPDKTLPVLRAAIDARQANRSFLEIDFT